MAKKREQIASRYSKEIHHRNGCSQTLAKELPSVDGDVFCEGNGGQR